MKNWLGYRISPALSLFALLGQLERGNRDGREPKIIAPVQTADPARQGGTRFDLGIGANLLMGDSGHRLALEAVAPLLERLDGPQMKSDWVVTLGWQYSP